MTADAREQSKQTLVRLCKTINKTKIKQLTAVKYERNNNVGVYSFSPFVAYGKYKTVNNRISGSINVCSTGENTEREV